MRDPKSESFNQSLTVVCHEHYVLPLLQLFPDVDALLHRVGEAVVGVDGEALGPELGRVLVDLGSDSIGKHGFSFSLKKPQECSLR